jgi:hypothetical protein
MQTLHNAFHIGRKSAAIILGIMVASSACLFFVPHDWQILRFSALMLQAFCGGLLASQHAAIWEPSKKEKASEGPQLNFELHRKLLETGQFNPVNSVEEFTDLLANQNTGSK